MNINLKINSYFMWHTTAYLLFRGINLDKNFTWNCCHFSPKKNYHRTESLYSEYIFLYFTLNLRNKVNFFFYYVGKNVFVFIYASVLIWNTMQNVRCIRIMVFDGTVKMNAEFAAGAKNYHSVNSPYYSIK